MPQYGWHIFVRFGPLGAFLCPDSSWVVRVVYWAWRWSEAIAMESQVLLQAISITTTTNDAALLETLLRGT